MPQAPRRLSPYDSMLNFFGAELRHWREVRGLSQDALGRLVHVSGDTLSKVEKASRWPARHLAESCDTALTTGGILTRLWPFVDTERRGSQGHGSPGVGDGMVTTALGEGSVLLQVDEEDNVWAQLDRRKFLVATGSMVGVLAGGGLISASRVLAPDDSFGFASTVSRRWPNARLSRPLPGYGVDWTLLLPGGQSLMGSDVAVQLHPARPDGDRVMLAVSQSPRTGAFLGKPGRRVLVGACSDSDDPRFFLLDGHLVRGRVAAGSSDVPIPGGYELDDLTFGILWAVANLDDALLTDDAVLGEALADLRTYEQLPSSAVSHEAAPVLNPIAHMWLGSTFCAQHILRALPELPNIPTFWTREQRGEEAITWLLFDHKYHYLRRCLGLLDNDLNRGFCIPESAVTNSPRYERVMLFLAAALMESLGIHVEITTDPAYADVEGFVVAPSQQAILANWVRGEGIWHVDRNVRLSTVRDFTDVSADVSANSLTKAPTAPGRLRILANYLDLEWSWLVRRSAALAKSGTERLARVQSSRLSPVGLVS